MTFTPTSEELAGCFADLLTRDLDFRRICASDRRRRAIWATLLAMLVGLVFLGFALLESRRNAWFHPAWGFLLGTAAALVVYWATLPRWRAYLRRRAEGACEETVKRGNRSVPSPTFVRIDAEGLRFRTTLIDVFVRWPALNLLTTVERGVVFNLSRAQCFSLPRSAFADQASLDRFVARADEFWQKSGHHTDELARQVMATETARCPDCWYSLHGIGTARCPECGLLMDREFFEAHA